MAGTWNIRQSLARWCFGKTELPDLCELARGIGFDGIDLVEPAQWGILNAHGLICSLCPSHPISKGLNNPAHHAMCESAIRSAIDASAAGGCPNVVCFSGNRGAIDDQQRAIDDEQGAIHCIAVLKRIAGYAESNGVTLCLELLNSKDHHGYMCDRTSWGVKVCEAVDSQNVKLLYDVYHMQKMEGDLIDMIQRNASWIGHVHTAGVPGRGELDAKQEINYSAVFAALRKQGFAGWIGHEFIPAGDTTSALRSAYELARDSG